MKKLLVVALAAALAGNSALAQFVLAQSEPAPELARQKNCLACHSVDKKIVGPAYRDIAARYAGAAGAQERLAKKVREGGTGVWGRAVMPANPRISEAESQTLAQWILSLK